MKELFLKDLSGLRVYSLSLKSQYKIKHDDFMIFEREREREKSAVKCHGPTVNLRNSVSHQVVTVNFDFVQVYISTNTMKLFK